MVCLGFEPVAEGCKAQTKPPSYGGRPEQKLLFIGFQKNRYFYGDENLKKIAYFLLHSRSTTQLLLKPVNNSSSKRQQQQQQQCSSTTKCRP